MALALDGSVHKNISTGASTTVTLTTTISGDVIVLFVAVNSASGTGGNQVSSITSASATYSKRAGQSTAGNSGIEEWRGAASGILSSEVITINFVGGVTFATIDAFGISGADTSTIYDSNGALPAKGTTSTVSLTTSNANDFLMGGYRFGSTASPTQGAGWTKISGANFSLTEYQIVAATQSGLAVTIGTGNTDENAGIGDAIMQASAGGASRGLFLPVNLDGLSAGGSFFADRLAS